VAHRIKPRAIIHRTPPNYLHKCDVPPVYRVVEGEPLDRFSQPPLFTELLRKACLPNPIASNFPLR
jgi:hypothetical protein